VRWLIFLYLSPEVTLSPRLSSPSPSLHYYCLSCLLSYYYYTA